jgi:maleylpyruvate isomerase
VVARSGTVPEEWVAGCIDGHRRLETLLTTGLTDELVPTPSRLPGWTVGHLVTHLARNADGHIRVFEGAGRGETVSMYPGGTEGRAAEIEAGAHRGAQELVADVLASRRRLEDAWAATQHETWADGVGMRGSGPTTLADMVFIRWREVEVHMADLGLPGVPANPWDLMPLTYVAREFLETTSRLGPRLPRGITLVLVPGDLPSRAVGNGPEVVHVHAPAGRLLAWLMGRSSGDPAWPRLEPWAY